MGRKIIIFFFGHVAFDTSLRNPKENTMEGIELKVGAQLGETGQRCKFKSHHHTDSVCVGEHAIGSRK